VNKDRPILSAADRYIRYPFLYISWI